MAHYATGSDVDAPCNRCKLELAHVVVATVGGIPAQVQCKTCGNVHKYRAPSRSKSPSTPRATRASRPTAASSSARVPSFFELSADQIAQNVPYSPSRTFRAGEVIAHPTFGYGCVEHVGEGKIEVSFREQRRVLIHNRPTA